MIVVFIRFPIKSLKYKAVTWNKNNVGCRVWYLLNKTQSVGMDTNYTLKWNYQEKEQYLVFIYKQVKIEYKSFAKNIPSNLNISPLPSSYLWKIEMDWTCIFYNIQNYSNLNFVFLKQIPLSWPFLYESSYSLSFIYYL